MFLYWHLIGDSQIYDGVEEAKANPEYPSKGEVCDKNQYLRHIMLQIVLVGHDRCKTWLYQERLSHYCPMYIWKAYGIRVCNDVIHVEH